jgi:hypothetical protein
MFRLTLADVYGMFALAAGTLAVLVIAAAVVTNVLAVL